MRHGWEFETGQMDIVGQDMVRVHATLNTIIS